MLPHDNGISRSEALRKDRLGMDMDFLPDVALVRGDCGLADRIFIDCGSRLLN